ncbi:sigma-54-dependent Fis family transcriptional regulator [Clostridiaceae bacterium 35-E11]
MLYSLDDRMKIANAWENFISNGTIDPAHVRKVILQSWLRSKKYNVNPISIDKPILSEKALQQRIERRKAVINIAHPYLQNLYRFVQGSGFYLIFADEQGYLLELLGDPDTIERGKKTKLVLGANRCETTTGTNAIGTCLAIDQPIQIYGEEHYFKEHHSWTCSAAPIHDPSGNLLGCIDITGPRDKVHAHTLGMIVAAVDGIEKQMQMENTYNMISIVNNQLHATLESMSVGIILIDNEGIITQANDLAVSMLGSKDKEIIGISFTQFITYEKNSPNILQLNENIYDHEIHLTLPNNTLLNCTLSATLVKDRHGVKTGLVITLKEIKFVHKLINRMTGSQAQFTFDSIIGNSKPLEESIRLAKIAAQSPSNVLLLGESGTGKELFAQAIHNMSNRSDGPFIAINCGALPRGLIESELFGYEGGAFTGSKKEGHPGKFELANGGTIFLDEIGDMPIDIQVTLLRVLQNREVLRIGGKHAKKIDVRIIAATHKNLEEAVYNKSFRSDLYYRLNVFSIQIPPLKHRKQDIPLLADYFLIKSNMRIHKQVIGFTDEVYGLLTSYTWPGNVRELENTIERAVNVAQNKYVTLADLPPHLNKDFVNTPIASPTPSPVSSMQILEREAIIQALQETQGNVKKAAEILSIARRTLYRKLEKFSIDIDTYR